jgi:hypothetical protein
VYRARPTGSLIVRGLTRPEENAACPWWPPLTVNVIYAPVGGVSAIFPYCHSVTILEWNIGREIVLPSVAVPDSPVSNHSIPGFNALIYFFAMHRNLFWCINADSHNLAIDTKHGYRHNITDNQFFTNSPREY